MSAKRISEFFHWGEVSRSETALRLGIDNTLPRNLRRNAKLYHDKILYPLRHYLGQPLYLSSWYRSPALNDSVGGSKSSMHPLARAGDLWAHDITPFDLCDLIIALALPYDQVINEFGRWCHVGIQPPGVRRPRLQIITMHRPDGPGGRSTRLAGLHRVDPLTQRLA